MNENAGEIVKALLCNDAPDEPDGMGCANKKCKYRDSDGACNIVAMCRDAADKITELNDFRNSQCAKLLAHIAELEAQLAAYQKYGEPCDWRNAQDDAKEIARLKAENLDIAKQLAESQRRERAAVVLYNGRNPDRTMRCSCPACGRLFQEESFVENYCPNCGQRLGRGPQEARKERRNEPTG